MNDRRPTLASIPFEKEKTMEAECRLAPLGAWLGSVGPYALVELLVPGGTLIMLLLLWLRRRRAQRPEGASPARTAPAWGTSP
ncbi:MAG TPA: hypothetical protein VFE23_07365 [Usitatibacter sp.]|nr:hypothetical protein [Usitatibacter sp.]